MMVNVQRRGRVGLGDTRTAAGTVLTTTATGAKIGSAIAPGIGTAIGAAAGAIAGAVTALLIRQGPKQKIQASKDVDLFEPYFQANLATFKAGQVSKADALQTFDVLWEKLVTDLSQPQLGEPGRRAIQERGRNGTPHWGLNWYQLYRDPIESTEESAIETLLPKNITDFTATNEWLIPAALILVVGVMLI